MGRSSMQVLMAVKHADSGDTAFTAKLLLVNFDDETMASREIPDWVRSKIKIYEGIE